MKKNVFFSLLFLLLVSLVSNSCDMPETEIAIAQDFMTHVAQVSFIKDTSNEAAGKLLEELDNTKVTITGPDKDKVYSIEGKKEYVIQGGMLHLLLDPSIEFASDSETYTVNLIIEPAGYLKRNVPITFVKDVNTSFYEVAMLQKTSLPKGINLTTNTNETVGTDTGLNTAINLTASNATTEGVSTEITIPKGLKMRDSSGLLSGSLSVEVYSFSEADNTTAYYPGGLMPTNVDMGNGTSAEGAFVSAGFTTINMTVGGKKVKTFEGGAVAVKMTLSKTNFNPKTGNPFKKDDKIDIWSYEDDNGQWKFESTGTVKEDANGLLYVSFETKHLSSFNLDYLFGGNEGRCRYSKLKINWAGVDIANKTNCRFTIKYVGPGNASGWNQLVVTNQAEIYDGHYIDLKNAPQLPVEIEIYDIKNQKSIAKKTFAKGELCSGGSINITSIPVKKPLVTLTYQGMCTKAKVLPPVGTRVYYRKTGTTGWIQFHYVDFNRRFDNKITTNVLTVGQTYDFKIFAGGKSLEQKGINISRADFYIDVKLSDAICNALLK